MKIRADRSGAIVLVEMEGELDSDGSVELAERCRFEQQEGGLHFVIALGGLTRISGSGLRVLLGLARSLPGAGGSLMLCELEPKVQEALQVSGLAGTFELAPERALALERAQQRQSALRSPPAIDRADAEERIAYAIGLLGQSDDDPHAAKRRDGG